MCKSKNRYFYHILVSPGDAPGAITLNVVWMEREFDAHNCLAACAHLTIIVSEIEWDICEKNRNFINHTPLHSTPPLGGFRQNIVIPFGVEKLEWCGYKKVKKNFEDMFNRLGTIPACDRQTDWQTDRHLATAYTRTHTRRAVKIIGLCCTPAKFIITSATNNNARVQNDVDS